MKNILIKVNQFNEEKLLYNEWLITNGIGGYACGSISGTPTRKFHSLLTAALPNPFGRTLMLNYVADFLVFPDKKQVQLSPLRQKEKEKVQFLYPLEFRLENGLPIWIYDINGVILEKSLLLIHQQNTLHVSYKLKSQHEGLEIRWQPFFHFRPIDQPLNKNGSDLAYIVRAKDSEYEIEYSGYPTLKLFNVAKTPFILKPETVSPIFYEIESSRGYPSLGTLKSLGFYSTPLIPEKRTTFIASTEDWKTIFALSPQEAWAMENLRKKRLIKTANDNAKTPITGLLTLAADQFLMKPITRFNDTVRLQSSGEEIQSVIAGFPWFNDWGRDTMISLEGLTLTTGRYRLAHSILHTFAYYIHEGLIPNMFPEGENKGYYNTADATLWFFHAIDRYVDITGDQEILEFLLPKLEGIISYHIKGTLFGIKMDRDGLLIQGYPKTQLTWMDAKVGDWVVTPRRGKAVEINGLWYNALRLYEKWTNKKADLSKLCYESFNQKFWYEDGHYLYDVIEGESGNDSALRPNQLFAISLTHPVLEENRWRAVLEAVQRDLYTPVGLRTLSPHHPDYKEKYDGDIKARDAAYHQGSVWPWLIGAYADVCLKVNPSDFKSVHKILSDLADHVFDNCLGTIGEIFDASPPYKARGCFAQAWSVAEVLRCLARLNRKLEESH